MMATRWIALIGTGAALIAPQLALAQPALALPAPACLTPREFTALATYALPSVIAGTARACAATLPAGAYLRRSGTDLAQRYAGARPGSWPEAKVAFIKMASARDQGAARIFAAMPDDTLQQVADAALAGIVTGEVKPDSCGTIDRAVALLAPLPVENTAELIALLVGLGARVGQTPFGSLPICKA